MAASATFALKSGEWFRRVRFVIFAPDSHAQPCALSGRNSTYRTDRNCGATSMPLATLKLKNTELPPYLEISEIIKGTDSLNRYLTGVKRGLRKSVTAGA